jgi:methionyl-tRNA formyltransferase
MLSAPVYEPINVHYSILPKHRGASPIQSTILAGDKAAGISIMKMTKGLDEGPIYKKFKIDIKESNKEELEDKLSVIAAKNITSVLSEIKNKNIKPIDQNEDDASYCKKIKKESGLINLQKDNAEKILLKFRAYKGWPGVFFRYKDVDIKIHGLMLLDPNDDIHMENSGSIFKVTRDGLIIKTIDSKIVITHLQMPGKKVINKSDIYNAYSNYFE